MIGEKFIEKKIEGNKIIIISEFKEFNYDFENIAQYFNDYIDDDPEVLYNNGIYQDFNDFYGLECERVLEKVEELLEEAQEEDEGIDKSIIKSFVKPLQEAKDFTIYFKRTKEQYYKSWRVEE